MVKLIAACLGLAALSLLLPSEPSYDPWAWLVWGREILHLELDTSGGPSWKPLTAAVGVLLAPLAELDSGVPPALWMVIARAGALLALALAFMLARRLAGGGRLGMLAGVVTAGALALTPDGLQFAAHGSEAPLAVALMLWAVLRHLDGHPGHAFVLGVLGCLLRPELFIFLGLYALWLWFAEPARRRLIGGLLALMAVVWLVPEWLGAGNPLDGGAQARSEPFWSLSHHESPWKRAALRVHNHAGLVVELLAFVAVAVALARRQWAVLVLAVAGLGEALLYLAMTEAGFSGNPRYVLPALVLGCVLAGVGAARVAELAAVAAKRIAPRARAAPLAAGAAATLAVAVAALPYVDERVGKLRYEAREVERRMAIHSDLVPAIEAAGGAEAINGLGPATASRALHTRLAWELGRPIQEIEGAHGEGAVFRSARERLAGRVYTWGRPKRRVVLARHGSWSVYVREGVPEWVYIRGVAWAFTRSLQGINIPGLGDRIALTRVVTK